MGTATVDKRSKLIELIYTKKTYFISIAWKILKCRNRAEDIIQEVALKVLTKRDDQLPAENSERAWLSMCIYHAALDARTIQKRRDFRDLSTPEMQQSIAENNLSLQEIQEYQSPEFKVLQKERCQILSDAVAKLPKIQKEMILSHYVDQLSYSEILVGIQAESYNSVKANGRWGIQNLKNSLSKYKDAV